MRTIICVGTPSVASAMAASILRDEGWVVHNAEDMHVDRLWRDYTRLCHYAELRTKAVNRNFRPRIRYYRVKREVGVDDVNVALYMRSRFNMHKVAIMRRFACRSIMSDAIDTLPHSNEWTRGHERDGPWWMQI